MCRRGAFAGRPTQARLALGCGSHHGPTVGETPVRVIPLAAESLGVRSMATYVEAGDLGILIDPGATLAPARWGLPPADAEWQALRRANDRISAYAARARLIFVSHYHDDHFRSDPVTYAGHTVLAKDPRRMIAGAQARRGLALWKALEGQATVESADSWRRRDGAVELSVSPPLPHGVDGTALGHVVGLAVCDLVQRERFVFASDVQGPLSAVAAAWLAVERRAQAAGGRAAAGRDRRCYHDSRETYFRQKGERPVTDQKTLNVGDQAPAFTLKTIGMKDVSLGDYKGKNVVLLFYPLDWTPG